MLLDGCELFWLTRNNVYYQVNGLVACYGLFDPRWRLQIKQILLVMLVEFIQLYSLLFFFVPSIETRDI